jgi:hypothetical protein
MDTLQKKLLKLTFLLITTVVFVQTSKVAVVNDEKGAKLVVDGESFMINGINWDYIPIGTNTVNAEFWKKSDDVIKAGLDTEMSEILLLFLQPFQMQMSGRKLNLRSSTYRLHQHRTVNW